ncbi:MAG: arabinogalactan endo-1,4-beta-galactosidase, partial [Candidatus Phocaeicola faecipullorum]|nr:arabinogalactan endo-1,4-beta-galactosidase [Candidatus Phocaeicola faecipullorum]
ERECMELLRELGMNAIRLRVWVDPENGWCSKEDVIAKAWRAHNLGYRLMIDFHYSDEWADPGKQKKPIAWQNYSFDELKNAVSEHTKDVLSALKNLNIDVEWVQVGNETRYGMLWDDGKASSGNTANFAALINSGYDAVKEIYPNAQVIIHIDKGNNPNLYNWLFDGLKSDGAKWDIIGMSLYPGEDPEENDPNGVWQPTDENGKTWEQQNDDCIANMQALISKYNTKVMMCEIGIPWNYEEAEAFYTDFITKAKTVEGCLGVFAWEPQCYAGWNGYQKGMFNDEGYPMSSLNAFKR